MTAKQTTAPPKQSLVMLIETEPGELVLMDSQGKKLTARSGQALWDHAKAMLHAADAPALESAPGEETAQAKEANKEANKASKEDEVRKAWGTIGDKVREMAEAEYGAPVVKAAATVMGHATERTTSFARRHSRHGLSKRASLRRRGSR